MLLRHQHGLPVYSVLMRLQASAAASDHSGVYRAPGVRSEPIHEFRYNVVRVWEEASQRFLDAGPAFAPLALLTDEASSATDATLAGVRKRLSRRDVSRQLADDVLSLSSVLCGLRYDHETIRRLFMGGRNVLEDSVVYQDLIQRGKFVGRTEGRAEEARNLLARQARRKFGPPGTADDSALAATTDLERLERMADRIFDATSWSDLLATP